MSEEKYVEMLEDGTLYDYITNLQEDLRTGQEIIADLQHTIKDNEDTLIDKNECIDLLETQLTNLQQKIEQYENPDDMTLFYMWLDTKAKDKIKELQEENKRLFKEKLDIQKDFTNRIYKAIEYIKDDWYKLNTLDIEHCVNLGKDIRIDLLNILQNGSENNE